MSDLHKRPSEPPFNIFYVAAGLAHFERRRRCALGGMSPESDLHKNKTIYPCSLHWRCHRHRRRRLHRPTLARHHHTDGIHKRSVLDALCTAAAIARFESRQRRPLLAGCHLEVGIQISLGADLGALHVFVALACRGCPHCDKHHLKVAHSHPPPSLPSEPRYQNDH
ncbi:hypothetical protein C8R43DRAFT_307849 [Mycena crocata]|nr:hypothetical protein C8R43DRAFT_307849 [Mycena crocata]